MTEVQHDKFNSSLSGKFIEQSPFQEAAAYASEAARINPLYTHLAEGTSKNAYNIALADWFHPPVIHSVTRRDGCILVEASDNVQVTKILITIIDEVGTLIEQGYASLIDEPWWEYETPAATAGRVLVEAFDLPGNVTRQEA